MSLITTAIYGGGPFYPIAPDRSSTDLPATIALLKASGFTTVVEWGLQLNSDKTGSHVGDLQLNFPIVSDGVYIGDPDWPDMLAGLKTGTTSVDRLIFSVLGYEGGTFPTIQWLIETQGTTPDSILYRNFAALKQAIPAIDGIDFDDETLFDPDTTVKFAVMLGEIGYSITFCPFGDSGFWAGCLAAIEAQAPGLVTGFNLQCYAGGTGQQPASWAKAIAAATGWPLSRAAALVNPGLWCRNEEPGAEPGRCPSGIADQFAAWQPSGIQGGFIWLYDHLEKSVDSGLCGSEAMTAAAYASAIRRGLQPQTSSRSRKAKQERRRSPSRTKPAR